MKKSSIIVLKIALIAVGLVALGFMLVTPHFEGRNIGATFLEVYFKDPFLAYVYLTSIAFFTAFYQAFKLLTYIGKNEVFTSNSLKALRTIRHCATIIVAAIVGAEAWLVIFQRGKDDITGGIFMGLLIIAASGVVATIASVFEGIIRSKANLS